MATIVVTNGNASGAGSLAQAIALAESTAAADTITFQHVFVNVLTPSQFTLTTKITFDGDLDDDGVADINLVGKATIDGGRHALFRLESTADVTFDGMILRDGEFDELSTAPGAGAILNYGKATIKNSQFINNDASGGDGANGFEGADGGAGGDAAGAIYNAGVLSLSSTSFSLGSGYGGNGGDGGPGASGGIGGGSGGDGGNGGLGAAHIVNIAGATMTLSVVEFGSGSASRGPGGDGGKGGTGTVIGGNGGDGGDSGATSMGFVNLGSATGNFISNPGGSLSSGGGGAGGKGGVGGTRPGEDGSQGAGSPAGSGGVTVATDGNDVRAGLAGDESIYGLAGDDKLSGGTGVDILTGGDGDDTLDGGVGNDTLRGSKDNDRLKVSAGEDSYYGDEGVDTLDFGAVASAVTIDLDKAGTQLVFGGSVYLNKDIENVLGTAKNDVLSGTSAANVINGGDGADTMKGRGGSDTYAVDDAGDIVQESAGQGLDRILTSVSYALAANVSVEVMGTTSETGKGAINLTGNTLTQNLIGNDGANVLNDGGFGAPDSMEGRGGNDTYLVYNDGDEIIEGSAEGTSDKVAAGVDYALESNAHIEILTTTSSAGKASIDLTGNALKQSITGNAGDNMLSDGGAGAADTLTGLAGNDTYRVYNSGDVIVEGASQGTADKVVAAVDYNLAAGVQVEIMTTNGSAGKSGIDLGGNEFVQEIVGNAGDNRIEGRGGSDTLKGLLGNDTFVFATALGAGNVDTITDFKVVDDRFLLSDAIFTALSPGTLSAAAFRANTTGLAGDASDRIIYETDTGELYYDFNGNAAGGGVLFAVVTAGLAITNADFSVA